MAEMKALPVATVIGDLVGSRRSPDRRALHERLQAGLAAHATDEGVVEAPAVTVGDEFQAIYATVGAAIDATWRLWLDLAPEVDVRVGIGWGVVARLDDRVQDGPGWWDARDAITAVAQDERSVPGARRRCAYRSRLPDAPDVAAVNAALRCRDHLAGSLDDRSRHILEGLMAGRTQAQIADDEGISPAAVHQRYRNHGLAVLLAAGEELAHAGEPGGVSTS